MKEQINYSDEFDQRKTYRPKRLIKKRRFLFKKFLKLLIFIFLVAFVIKIVVPKGVKILKSASKREAIVKVDTFKDANELSAELNQLRELSLNDDNYAYIEKNLDDISAQMLRTVLKSPESIGFVKGYLTNEKNYCPKSDDLSVNSNIKYFSQWDRNWAYYPYCGEMIGTRGCGPTSIAMALNALGIEKNPKDIAKFATDNGFVTDNFTSWSIMDGIKDKYKIRVKTLNNSFNDIKNALSEGDVLIFSVRKGDFTTTGHMLVVNGYDDDKLKILDPNSPQNSNKLWEYEKIKTQIKNIWAFNK